MNIIGIYPNPEKDPELCGTKKVVSALAGRARLLAGSKFGAHILPGVEVVGDERLFSEPEAMIVLGGDGTILEAARSCAPAGIPLLGINLGRVGYMAELELDELGLLDRLLGGDFHIEQRMMLETELDSDGGIKKSFALNDAVLGGETPFRMVEIELLCDKKPVNRYRADGLIISTPTGSTAYSLSAGGAVVDPRMDAMIATPICSHSLNATPIVFSAGSELEMRNVTRGAERMILCVDGCENYSLCPGESVRLRRSPLRVGFIRLKDGGFYEILRHKMAEI